VRGCRHHLDQRRVLAMVDHIWRWPLTCLWPRTCAGWHRGLRRGHDLGDTEPGTQGTLDRARIGTRRWATSCSSVGHGHLRSRQMDGGRWCLYRSGRGLERGRNGRTRDGSLVEGGGCRAAVVGQDRLRRGWTLLLASHVQCVRKVTRKVFVW
jgi:hypothetical protein